MGRADDKDKEAKAQGAPGAGANPLLPPGLYNLGNSCFLNSVFQSLVATRAIERLIHDPAIQASAHRSPALASHQGEPDRRLPITSTFLRAAENAWAAQDKRLRQPLSLRELLMRLGHKYDQYLDFRQQDAHELLRHLLDAISSEESDIIREANPRPKKRRRTAADPDEDDGAAGPASFIDIVFGGTLASVLVCADCKHVSITHEPFNDLSLSLRTEPGRERKRDKFASFANKIQHMQGFRKATSGKRKPRPRSVPPPASASTPADANLERRGSTSDALGAGLPGGSSSDTGGGGLGRLLRWGKPKKSGDPLARPGTPRTLSARSSIELIGSRPTSPGGRRSPSVSPAPSPAPSAPPSPRLPSAALPEDPLTPRPMRTHFAPRSKAELDDVYLRRILADPQIPKADRDKDDGDKDKDAETLLDALRAFTAVERLEGENMIGCRRCWKKLHGVPCDAEGSSSSSSSSDSESDGEKNALRPPPPVRASSIHHKASASVASLPSLRVAPPQSDAADDADTSDLEGEQAPALAGSVASLPVRPSFVRSASVVDMSRAGLPPDNPYRGPIPSIETTAPDVDGLPTGQGSRHRRERAVGGREPSSAGTSVKGVDISPVHAPAPEPAASPASSVASLVPSSTVAPAASSPASSTTSLSPSTAPSQPRAKTKTKDPSGKGLPRSKQIVLRPTLKRYLVARAPQVLVLHLKRFQQVQASPLINFTSPFKKSGNSGNSGSGSGGGGGFTGQFNTGAKLFGLPGGYDDSVDEMPSGRGHVPADSLGGLPGGSDLWGGAGGYGSGSGWGVGGGNGTTFRKVDEWIEFPETLDLAPFVAPRREDLREGRGVKPGRMDYRLYAVVVHIGNMLGGHYVAYTALPPAPREERKPPSAADIPDGKAETPALAPKTASVSSGAAAGTAATPTSTSTPSSAATPTPAQQPRQWCFISDQHVRLCSFEEVLRAKAYICFYERVEA